VGVVEGKGERDGDAGRSPRKEDPAWGNETIRSCGSQISRLTRKQDHPARVGKKIATRGVIRGTDAALDVAIRNSPEPLQRRPRIPGVGSQDGNSGQSSRLLGFVVGVPSLLSETRPSLAEGKEYASSEAIPPKGRRRPRRESCHPARSNFALLFKKNRDSRTTGRSSNAPLHKGPAWHVGSRSYMPPFQEDSLILR